MAFKVPEKFRVTGGPFATTRAYGNNGLFLIKRERDMFRCIVSDGGGWEHVSVSLAGRTPTWKEMCFIKKQFWGKQDCVVQFHPPEREYVNYHPHCLHLWRCIEEKMPRPHPLMVGPYEAGKKT